MEEILIIVCAVVGSLGLLSAIFAFSAEGTKLTNPALGLGISAAIFLLVAQVTFTAVGGCCGCCGKSRSNPSSPSETKRIVGIVCAVVSWIAAVIAWVLLIEGAAWNANVVRTTTDAPYCPCLKDGIFAGAGVLCLAATALGITSYVLMRTKRVRVAAPQVVPAKLPPPAATQTPPADDTVQAQPPAMASATAPPPEPGQDELTPPPPVAETPPVQLPQEGVPQAQGSEEHLFRKRLTRVLIKLAVKLGMRVVVHSLCSGSIDTPTVPGVGDILDSMIEPQSTEAV